MTFNNHGTHGYQTYSENTYNDFSALSIHGYNNDAGDHSMQSLEEQVPTQDVSPASSEGSSPNFRNITGNRARATSLTTKNPHARSTAHITQQQINKKRQRATPEQLIVLEEAFAVNSSPNARMREVISAQISMTERSVQIWFQNRRAKTKQLHRKGGYDELGFQQAPYAIRPGLPARSYSIDQGLPQDYARLQNNVAPKSVINRLNCRSLTIGSWRRVACTAMDLVIYFSQNEPKFTYYINSSASGFKIEYAIATITKIDLRYLNNDSRELGRAVISLVRPPIFHMEIPITGGWKQCTDFSENQQATAVLNHALIGPYDQLKTSLTELASTYKETIGLMTFEDLEDTPIPKHIPSQQDFAIASPVPVRVPHSTTFSTPDSRLMRPNPGSASVLESTTNTRGAHRRTRSRSAPIAVDFSQFMQHQNVGGMPGYSFGQQSSRVDPNYRPHLDTHSQGLANQVDYTEPLYTPTTVATPGYQDPWYATSYANTPLLDTENLQLGSQLGSPMIPGSAQFELGPNGLSNDGFGNTFPITSQMQLGNLPNSSLITPTQSMPDLTHLESVPELLIQPQGYGIPSNSLQGSLLPEPLDISQMDFSNMPPAHMNGETDRMEH